ncbi:MAG: hypothetical protein C5B50_01395 [Verrucomicrobia bacterium]|nr:MAG: hypothetical protein C5B50_01395 [Verrucomicrobiota bacterium]
MNPSSVPRLKNWRFLLVYLAIPALVGFVVISRAFHGDGFLPLDASDEPAETFVQVPMAQSALSSGDILKINLFNNFGTPILGDPVVCPFAPHALTYAVFRPAVAMLINKFLMAALTMAALTAFFASYMPRGIASFCAFLAFSSPAFFYFFQYHPHQGALFYFTLGLLAWRRFAVSSSSPARRSLGEGGFSSSILLYVALLLFFVGVGTNGVLLGSAFILAFALLTTVGNWRALLFGLSLGATAFIAVHPHFVEFFRLAADSARKDFDYQTLVRVSPGDLVGGLFFRRDLNEMNWGIVADIFYSWPLLILIVAGLSLSIANAMRSGNTENQSPGLALGIVPLLVVLFLRFFHDLAARIPLLKAMNVTRILWFSDIFLMFAAGIALDAIRKRIAFLRRGAQERGIHAASPSAATSPLDSPTSKRELKRPQGRAPGPALIVFGGIALAGATLWIRGVAFYKEANFWSCEESYTQFQPARFLADMEPGKRLATLFDVFPMSQDAKANAHGILGSAGRAITLDRQFRDLLLSHHLIKPGFHGMTYSFVAAPPETLSRFGIRYCLSDNPSDSLAQWGWVLRDRVSDRSRQHQLLLYENPIPATPLYIDGSKIEFIQNYRLGVNEIEADLPATNSTFEVTVTFLNRPGWKAFVDGKPAVINSSPEHFIKVTVHQTTNVPSKLLLKYEPFTNMYLACCCVISVAAAVLISKWTSRRR